MVRHGRRGEPIELGLIGYGAIGRALVRLMRVHRLDDDVRLTVVLVRDAAAHREDATDLGVPIIDSFEAFAALPLDIVVEAAGHDAMRRHVPQVLRAGIDVIGVSSGALADPAVRDELEAAADAGGSQLRLVSGGIGGIDALGAGSLLGIKSVEHTVRKPPRALPERYAEPGRTDPYEVFVGTARVGALMFPENVNVVATVSLAGTGFDRTRLRVLADPSLARNVHELAVRGTFGELRVRMENVPSPGNPRTGVIVAGSVAQALQALSAPIVVGG
jgi:aspartate dehydrogenase